MIILRTTIVVLLGLFFVLTGAAQPNHTVAEYFFDTDPGFSNGALLMVTAGNDIEEDYELDISALTEGFHTLYVRTRDANGHWSHSSSTPFYIYESSTTIDAPHHAVAEYFFDVDSGVGQGTSFDLPNTVDIDGEFDLDISSLTFGAHRLYIRTKDEYDKWSITTTIDFEKACSPLIDSLALVALYEATGGANWNYMTTTYPSPTGQGSQAIPNAGNRWLQGPLSNWHGVVLTEDGCNIKELILHNSQLAGDLPTVIGDLSQLQHLCLSDNNLINGIPNELGNLTQLQYLNLSDNQLSGSLPTDALSNLSQLHTLNLADNQLVGNFSTTALSNLGQLRTIKAANNRLMGSFPDEFANLVNLQYLNLSNNLVSGVLPTSIGSLTKLIHLDLADNQLTGEVPIAISNMTLLQHLNLSDNLLTGQAIATTSQLKQLHYLNLSANRLEGAIPSSIGNLNLLEYLNLANNKLTGSLPTGLGNLSNLSMLNLRFNQLSGCFPGDFTPFCTINSADFSNNPNLPGGGDFVAFCRDGTGNCSEPTFVWPGDYNNDGTANQMDVLYWGLAKNNQGPSRPNATTNWTAQTAASWSMSINDINGKYQDGNGDGLVDSDDLSVIFSNYGKTHANSAAVASFTNGVTYRIESRGFQGNSTFKYDLFAELNDSPISTHGLAFTVDLNDLSVTNVQLDVANSSLNPDEHFIWFDVTTNKVAIALTRTDKTNQLCDGPIGSLLITMDGANAGESIQIDVEQGSRVKANGDFNGIASTSIFDAYSELTPSSSNFQPVVQVSHEECDKLGSAKVILSGGVSPYSILWNTGATTESIVNLLEGTYTLTVKDANNRSVDFSITIKKQHEPYYNENGQLVTCNPMPSSCAAMLNLSNTIPNGVHQAGSTIVSNGTVAASTNITFKAGQSISLTPGFIAEPDCEFLATIENCFASVQEQASTNISYKKEEEVETQNNQVPLALDIRPNPFKEQATIAYYLEEASMVQIILSDLQGKQQKVLVNHSFKEKGKHQLLFDGEGLAKGIYLISLQSENQLVTKKILFLD